jgi:hypothetical protein
VAAGIKKDVDLDLSFSPRDFMPYEDGYAELVEEASFDDWFIKESAKSRKP